MHVFLYQQSEHKAKFSCPGQTTFFPFYLSRKDAQFCPQEKDPFYHYPKHCTMEDETLSVFGEFGEVDEVFFTMEFT